MRARCLANGTCCLATQEPLLEDTRPITVQVYHSAFSDDGATRLPFYTRVCGKPGKYVAKVSGLLGCWLATQCWPSRLSHCQGGRA